VRLSIHELEHRVQLLWLSGWKRQVPINSARERTLYQSFKICSSNLLLIGQAFVSPERKKESNQKNEIFSNDDRAKINTQAGSPDVFF
jgi:hypothetical protein